MRQFLIPVAGRVLDPQTMRPLPAEGAWVDIASSGANGTYWRRRLLEGDVTDGTPAPAPAAEATRTNAPRRTARVRNS